jgi:hypothetical protein
MLILFVLILIPANSATAGLGHCLSNVYRDSTSEPEYYGEAFYSYRKAKNGRGSEERCLIVIESTFS